MDHVASSLSCLLAFYGHLYIPHFLIHKILNFNVSCVEVCTTYLAIYMYMYVSYIEIDGVHIHTSTCTLTSVHYTHIPSLPYTTHTYPRFHTLRTHTLVSIHIHIPTLASIHYICVYMYNTRIQLFVQ